MSLIIVLYSPIRALYTLIIAPYCPVMNCTPIIAVYSLIIAYYSLIIASNTLI